LGDVLALGEQLPHHRIDDADLAFAELIHHLFRVLLAMSRIERQLGSVQLLLDPRLFVDLRLDKRRQIATGSAQLVRTIEDLSVEASDLSQEQRLTIPQQL
jgi:hypothetical protein